MTRCLDSRSCRLSFPSLTAILLITLLVLGQQTTFAEPQPELTADGPSILQIKIVEGEGAIYPLGGRATRGLTVEISDGTGQPVRGATVSFTLPGEGASGIFTNGTRSEIVMTQGDGRATVWGMQWNRVAGPFDIRVTAAKGSARAGILSAASLTNEKIVGEKIAAPTATPKVPDSGIPSNSLTSRGSYKAPGGSHKWLWIGLAVGGAAAIGVAGLAARSSSSSASNGTSATGISIGSPSITLGHP